MPKRLCRAALCSAICLLLLFSTSRAQKAAGPYTKQFSIITENDRYVFKGKDGYYTNGLLLRYSRTAKPKANDLKRIHQFELGQKIFMPYDRKIYVPAQIDRPVSGYLYAKFSQSRFKPNGGLVQLGISADAIGEASLASGIQNTFHDWIGIDSRLWSWVWDYQVKNQVGLNLHGLYAHRLIAANKASTFQATPVTKATLGTSFTNLSLSVLLQAGKLQPQEQSAFWEGALGIDAAQQKSVEWSLFYQPELLYQVYNATVQGGLFRSDKGPITSPIQPFVFTHQVGALLSADRYLVRFSASFQTKEAKTQRFSQSFGSVQVGYRIR